MIAKKIVEHARLHVDDDFPWPHARRWINEAITLLASHCENGTTVVEVEEITSTGEAYYDLPENIGIKAVYKGEVNRSRRVQDYIEDGDRIYLRDNGLYLVEYERRAKDIGRDSDIPEVHELYHLPISYWVASREKLRFNPMDSDGLRLREEFYHQIRMVDNKLGKSNRVRKIKV